MILHRVVVGGVGAGCRGVAHGDRAGNGAIGCGKVELVGVFSVRKGRRGWV